MSRLSPLVAFASCCVTAVSATALATEPTAPAAEVALDVTVPASLDRIEGHARLSVTNTSGQPLEHVDLWVFPERLGRPPAGMDEISEDWVFPGAFDPGGMSLDHVRGADGAELAVERRGTTLVRVALAAPVPPGAAARLDVDFTTRVPHRFGPFGHADGQLTVDGGWFPRPPPLKADGRFDHASPPADLRYQVTLRFDGAAGAWAMLGSRSTEVGGDRGARPLGKSVAQRVTLSILSEPHVSFLEDRGTTFSFVHRRPRHRLDPSGLRDAGRIDVHAETLGTLAAGLRHLERAMAAMGVPFERPRRVVAVEAPLRRDIAIGGPEVLLVSDRAFEVIEFERLQKFHRIALLRAAYGTWLRDEIAPSQPLAWRDRAVDLVAVDLSERWEKSVYGRVDTAQALLAEGSFVALVDEALYAPQFPFQDAYFRSVDDTDRFRDRFELFAHRYPTGRRLHSKLLDMGERADVERVVDAVASGTSVPEAATRIAGVDEAFLRMWSEGRVPRVDYALGAISRGRDAQGRYLEVEILRRGDAAVHEPVTVQLMTGEPDPPAAVWNAPGPRGTVRIRLPDDVDTDDVEIDPGHRLVESDLGDNVDPRRNNRNFEEWKFLIQGFSLSFSSAVGRFEGLITTFLQPTHDLGHTILLQPFIDSRAMGLDAAWYAHLGPKIRPNKRRFTIATLLELSWLYADPAAPSAIGMRGSVAFQDLMGVSKIDPSDGHKLWVQAGVIVSDTDRTRVGGFAYVDASRVSEVASGHKLGIRGSFATLWGEVSRQHEWNLGGAYHVRAYDTLAQTGRHRATATLEWRHRFSRDLLLNVGQVGFVTSIHGVLFVDAALMSDDITQLPSDKSLYVGVGYGLRFFYLLGGLNPMLIRADIGIPIYTGSPLRSKGPPVSLVLAIDQHF